MTASMARGSSEARSSAGAAGVGRERRCMEFEASLQGVGVDREDLIEGIDREPALLDAVVAAENGFRHRVRPRVQAPEPLGFAECLPAFAFRVAPVRAARFRWNSNTLLYVPTRNTRV